MVLDRDEKLDRSSEFELRDDDRPNDYLYDTDSGRSNFVAFLLGGVVIAGGLLSFLYYDSNNLQGYENSAPASLTQPATGLPPVPSIRTTDR